MFLLNDFPNYKFAMICRQSGIFVMYGHTTGTTAYPDFNTSLFNCNRVGAFAQSPARAEKLYLERYHSEYLPDGA